MLEYGEAGIQRGWIIVMMHDSDARLGMGMDG